MTSQVKQAPVRTESRARRAGTVDASAVRPNRARRVPSSSRIDFHAPFPSASIESVGGSSSASIPFSFACSPFTLHSVSDALLHTVSYFTLFAMLHSNPSLPGSLLNLPIFVFPTIAFSILALYPFFMRPSFSTIRLHLSRSTSSVATVALVILTLYSSLTASYAVRHLGPIRALIAFSSYSTISRLLATLIRTVAYIASPMSREHYRQNLQQQQQQSQPQQTRSTLSLPSSSSSSKPKLLLMPLFLTTVALVFLVHDASGGRITPERAAHVRERVLRNPTARLMHDHFRNLSSRVSQSIHNKSFPSVHLPIHPTERLRDLRRTLSNIPHKPPLISKQRDSSRRANHRRSLQPSANAIVLPQNDSDTRPLVPPLQPAPQSVADVHSTRSRRRQRSIRTINDTLQSNDTTTNADINDGFAEQQTNDSTHSVGLKYETVEDQSSSERIEKVIDIDSFPSIPFRRAVLSVFLATTSPLARRLGSEIFDRFMFDLGEPTSFLALAFSFASLALGLFSLPFLATNSISDTLFDASDVFAKGSFVGFTFFVVPLISQIRSAGAWQRGFQPRPSKAGIFPFIADVSLLDVMTSSSSTPWLCAMAFVIAQAAYALGWTTVRRAESFSFFSGSAAALLVVAGFTERVPDFKGSRHESGSWNSRSLDRQPSQFRFNRRFVLWSRRVIRSMGDASVAAMAAISDLGAHARTNRASWQVLNFLVLQTGMAVAELIYASATHASGLFSISADNFFCSVALALGLLTIRVSTRKPTLRFSYGFFRAESICGFANGVMLIYVALLIFLEAFERVSIKDEQSAVGRAVSVCLFGIVGNALGLYFFPPETRRENHNVQGIYLHILANTLAFSSVAVSAAASAIVPSQWWVVDICTATIAACVVVASALPLIVRSGRLLLLRVSPEKVGIVQSLQQRLRNIDGVCAMHGLRVWNLTPSCLMASVKLEVQEEADELHTDVLSHARASFAMAGIAASQCTIQISCHKGAAVESDYPHDGGGSLASDNGSTCLNRSLYFDEGESGKAV